MIYFTVDSGEILYAVYKNIDGGMKCETVSCNYDGPLTFPAGHLRQSCRAQWELKANGMNVTEPDRQSFIDMMDPAYAKIA